MPPSSSIQSFTEKFAFLGQFYKSGFYYGHDVYQSAAAALEAAKIVNPPDRVSFMGFNCKPWNARRLGKGTPQYWMRPDWALMEPEIMLEIQRSKFSWPDLRNLLLATGDVQLINENAAHDNYWGVCQCQKLPTEKQKYGLGARCKGDGTNRLGKILMQVRQECQDGLLLGTPITFMPEPPIQVSHALDADRSAEQMSA
jgi:ribA/ribD-fused uncharacterized protein